MRVPAQWHPLSFCRLKNLSPRIYLAVMSMAIGKYVTTKEAADICGVSAIRVRQFVSEGRLKNVVRQGQLLFLDEQEVQEFAQRDRPPGRPPQQER